MDLWIRSQDKKMLRINPELEIYEGNNKNILIIDTKGSTDYYIAKILGQYKTEERALEVLDEIQRLLQPKTIIKFDSMLSKKEIKEFKSSVEPLCNNTIVYTMPEE